MLDIKQIRNDPAGILEKLRRKDPSVDFTDLLQLDERLRELITETENLKSQRNDLSKQIGQLKQKGQDAADLMAEVQKIGDQLSQLDPAIKDVEEKWKY